MVFSGATIDPGIHTAIAKWNCNTLTSIKTINLKGSNDAELLQDLANKIHDPDTHAEVIIEDVRLFTSSAISLASGARGNLTTLAKIAGAIAFYYSYSGVSFVNPQKWKGQLNYDQLRRILKIKFKYIARNEHEASAYGIGMYVQGKL
jgi:hypothetical protein